MTAPTAAPDRSLPATPDAGFWRGRRTFLTGHTGFKGGWLALVLERLGAEVHGYALAPVEGSLVHALARTASSTLGDVRDARALADAMARVQPEVVLHLAAQPLVRLAYREPVATVEANVIGTMNLLEAVRRTPSVRAVVVVTTDKVYRNREWEWGYREDEPLGGHDPYSASKACTELVAAAWRDSFLAAGAEDGRDVRVATARAGNVIGGGDVAADRLVPDVLREIAAGRPVTLRNPAATRPWQHVLEPLEGYLALAERLAGEGGERFARAWNFGPADDDALPVGELVDRLRSLWPGGGEVRHEGAGHAHEAGLLKLDSALARARLGWRPVWRLDDALADIVAWELGRLDGRDPRELSLGSIEARAAARAGGAASPARTGAAPEHPRRETPHR